MIRLLDYFFILRPILFFPGWTTTLAGYLCARGLSDPLVVWQEPVDHTLLLILLASAMMMGAGFVVNQIFDADTDRLNNKLFFLANGVVPVRSAVVEVAAFLTGALVIAWFVSPVMFSIFCAAALLFTVLYNMPPARLKDRVLGSFAANAFMGVLAFAYGWFTAGSRPSEFLADLLPYVFFNTGLYFLTTIPDAQGDGHVSKRTVCVVYGVRTTLHWASVFEAVSVILAGIRFDLIILVPALLITPLYVLALIRQDRASVIRTIKFGLFFFAMMVGIYFPVFFALIIFFFFFTRWYYRKRFNMDYPNFKGD